MSRKIIIDYEEYQNLIKASEYISKDQYWYYDGYTMSIMGEETEALKVMKSECERLKVRNKHFVDEILKLPTWIQKLFNISPYLES